MSYALAAYGIATLAFVVYGLRLRRSRRELERRISSAQNQISVDKDGGAEV